MKELLYLKSESIVSISVSDKKEFIVRKTDEVVEQRNFWGRLVSSYKKPMYSLAWCTVATPSEVVNYYNVGNRLNNPDGIKIFYDEKNDKFYEYPKVTVQYMSVDEKVEKTIQFDSYDEARIAAKDLSDESKIDFVLIKN